MENKGLWIGIGVTLCVAAASLVLALRSPVSVFVSSTTGGEQPQVQVSEPVFGGTTGLDSLLLRGDLTVRGESTFTGSLGDVNATSLRASSTVIGSSGSLISGFFRATSTINPDAITAGSATSINVTLPGVVAGDMVEVGVVSGDLGGTTSTIDLRGIVTATDTVQIVFRNYANTSTQASFNAGANVLWYEGTR